MGVECKHPVQEIVEKVAENTCILVCIEFFFASNATYNFYCLNHLALERSLKKVFMWGLYAADFKILFVKVN